MSSTLSRSRLLARLAWLESPATRATFCKRDLARKARNVRKALRQAKQ